MMTNLHDLPKTALVNSRDAAQYLGCSASWLGIMRLRGGGPAHIKHGSYVRYRIGDLLAWTERHRVATVSQAIA